jgi:hypothetical protein
MHSHDRTLLARLGFADPDKKNIDHDAACMYVAQQDVANLVVTTAIERGPKWSADTMQDLNVDLLAVRQEYHLQKGEGQYATTIGFIDVIAHARCSCKDKATAQPRMIYADTFFVEVKINPVRIGDILRQMNLYRSYLKGMPHGVVVTSWELSHAEDMAVRREGHVWMQLGEGFRLWQEDQQTKRPARIAI